MVLNKAVDIGIKIAPIIAKYARGFGKFTSGETTFVSRFPPSYRANVRTVLKGAQTVGYGTLISDILKSDDPSQQPNGFRSKNGFKYPSSKFNQAYHRRRRRVKRCNCKRRSSRRYRSYF